MGESNKLNSLLLQYCDLFGENFPVMALGSTGEEELISLIEACIETGEPYYIDYEENTVY